MYNNLNEKLTDIGFGQQQPEYLNLSFRKADAGEESEKAYQQAKTNYPYPKPGTCENIKKVIDQVQLEVEAAQKARVSSMAGKGSGRPEQYRINGYSKWKTELDQSYISYNCVKLQEQKEQEEVFGTFTEQLDKAKTDTEKSDKLTTYIVFGMLGMVVLVSGILLLKK
jgi:hypothetical protein